MTASAARGAAGYLYAHGRLRGVHGRELGQGKSRQQHEAERAAEALKRERAAKESFNPRKGKGEVK